MLPVLNNIVRDYPSLCRSLSARFGGCPFEFIHLT